MSTETTTETPVVDIAGLTTDQKHERRGIPCVS